MELKITENIVIKCGRPTFIIAEIGQNHQGDINIAKKLIVAAKESGADCVKLQKSCLTRKFTSSALDRPYENENSWGKTYREHKEFLEFKEEEFLELQTFAEEQKILFTASAMDLDSLEFLDKIKVPFIKIGSGDANNFVLIERAAKLYKPLIISTGMQSMETIGKIYKTVSKYHKQFALLHCISSYPCEEEDINLNVIKVLQKEFPDIQIGYSGHEIGYDISPMAVIAGASILERHFTLDKDQKGSDHKCSLIPEEFTKMVKEIRRMEKILGRFDRQILQSEIPCRRKLGKSLVAAQDLKQSQTLSFQDIDVKVSEPPGISAEKLFETIGRTLCQDVNFDNPITEDVLI